MSGLVPPHGGKLVPLLVLDDKRETGLKEALRPTTVRLSTKEVSDLIMLGMGAFSPLQGFMGKKDYQRVLAEMRLSGGLLWPIPITLSVSKEEANQIKEEESIALVDASSNEVMASMLAQRERPPEQFTRKEVADILVKYYQGEATA